MQAAIAEAGAGAGAGAPALGGGDDPAGWSKILTSMYGNKTQQGSCEMAGSVTYTLEVPASCCLAVTVSCTTCKIGTAKAPVLPLPVSAATITSPPPRISGTASACTGVGNLWSSRKHALSYFLQQGPLSSVRTSSNRIVRKAPGNNEAVYP